MTYAVTLQVPDDVLREINVAAQRAPKLVNAAFTRAVRPTAQRIVRTLKAPAPPVKYPIRWKSEKQRRAFFATNGFGAGIPTRRTGKLNEGWKYTIRKLGDGGAFDVFNNVPYARYVQGDDAQPFHLRTGWTQAAPTIASYAPKLEEVLIQTWYTLTDPFAGVRG